MRSKVYKIETTNRYKAIAIYQKLTHNASVVSVIKSYDCIVKAYVIEYQYAR